MTVSPGQESMHTCACMTVLVYLSTYLSIQHNHTSIVGKSQNIKLVISIRSFIQILHQVLRNFTRNILTLSSERTSLFSFPFICCRHYSNFSLGYLGIQSDVTWRGRTAVIAGQIQSIDKD